MKFSGEKMSIPQNIDVYINSYITRYIPGKVWAIAFRAILNKKYNVKMLKSAWGWFVENLGYLLISCFFSIFVLIRLADSELALITLIPVVLIVGILVFLNYEKLGFVFDKFIVKKLPSKYANETGVLELSIRHKLIILLLYVISWTIYSLQFFLVANSLTGIEVREVLFLAGINALAYAVGYLFIIMPSGSGIREGTMVASLNFLNIVSGVESLIIALGARLTVVLGELIFWLGFKVYYLLLKRNHEKA